MMMNCLRFGSFGAAKYLAIRYRLSEKFMAAAQPNEGDADEGDAGEDDANEGDADEVNANKKNKYGDVANKAPRACLRGIPICNENSDAENSDVLNWRNFRIDKHNNYVSLASEMLETVCSIESIVSARLIAVISWIIRIAGPCLEIQAVLDAFRYCCRYGDFNTARWIAKRYPFDKCTILCTQSKRQSSLLCAAINGHAKPADIQWLVTRFSITIDDLRVGSVCQKHEGADNSDDSDDSDDSDPSNDSNDKGLLKAILGSPKILQWMIRHFHLDAAFLRLGSKNLSIIETLCKGDCTIGQIVHIAQTMRLSTADLGILDETRAFDDFTSLLYRAHCASALSGLNWFATNYLPPTAMWASARIKQIFRGGRSMHFGAVYWLLSNLSDAQMPEMSTIINLLYNQTHRCAPRRPNRSGRHDDGSECTLPGPAERAEWIITNCARFMSIQKQAPKEQAPKEQASSKRRPKYPSGDDSDLD